jgi:hypothetical protein
MKIRSVAHETVDEGNWRTSLELFLENLPKTILTRLDFQSYDFILHEL